MDRKRTRKPRPKVLGRFSNHVQVKPGLTEVTLTLGQYHSGSSDEEPIQWRVDPVARFTLPYAAVKSVVFNLLGCIASVEHNCGGPIVVPPSLRPNMPSTEHVGPTAAVWLEMIYAELFGPHRAIVGAAACTDQIRH